MHCPHCAHPDYILFGKNRRAQRYRCQACQWTFQKKLRGKDPVLKEQAQKLYLEGLGLRAISRIPWAHYKTVSCWLVQAAGQLLVTNLRRRPAFLLRSMNSAVLLLEKSKCWVRVAVDSTFGNVLGFVRGSRSIRTARRLFKQLMDLPTMGYGTDFLKTYENLISSALHHQARHSLLIESLNSRLRHYLARLHSWTLCYSKSKRMLEISLKLLIHKLDNA